MKTKKELLQAKKQVVEMIMNDKVNTIVLSTDIGICAIGSSIDICKVLGELFMTLKNQGFNALDIIKEALDFVCMKPEEQKEYLKDELEKMAKKVDEIKVEE